METKTENKNPNNATKAALGKRKAAEVDDTMTIEEYLTQKCDEIVKDGHAQTAFYIQSLQERFEIEKGEIMKLAEEQQAGGNKEVKVTLIAASGPHMDNCFTLKLQSSQPCFIGRSTSKKFRENGVSLHKDFEVSTSHAQIFAKDNKVFLKDLNSTNGTKFESVELESGDKVELKRGSKFTVGETDIEVEISMPQCDSS